MSGNITQGFGFNKGGSSGGGGTNTNIANADLTLDTNHSTNVDNNTLTFKNGATNIAQMTGAGRLQVGAATPYIMPNARYGAIGGAIQSTDTTTGTTWVRNGFTLPFRLYEEGITSFNYYYPEPMTNNKALALASDAGANRISLLSLTTPNVLRRSLALPGGAGISIRDISFWGSCVDNVAGTTPQIEVTIGQTTPTQGSAANLGVTSVITATTDATGDNNSRLYQATNSLATPIDVGQYAFLIPFFILKLEEPPEEINYDVYINGSISGFYSS